MQVQADKIETLVKGIATARMNALLASDEATEAEDAAALRKAAIAVEVADEVDSVGKPIYSNAEKRAAEVSLRLSSDPLYTALDEKRKGARGRAILADIELDSIRSIIKLLASGISWDGDVEGAVNRTLEAVGGIVGDSR